MNVSYGLSLDSHFLSSSFFFLQTIYASNRSGNGESRTQQHRRVKLRPRTSNFTTDTGSFERHRAEEPVRVFEKCAIIRFGAAAVARSTNTQLWRHQTLG